MNPNLKFQMKNKIYVFHSDPGHAWLAVKKREIEVLGFGDKISVYSYTKGNTVYLEEDCDAALFFEAYEREFGKRPAYVDSYMDRSPIRYYDGFRHSLFANSECPSEMA